MGTRCRYAAARGRDANSRLFETLHPTHDMVPSTDPDAGNDHQTEPERLLLVQRLKEDRVEEYVELHQNVPDAVSELMENNGVYRYDLYIYQELAISYLVVDDFDSFTDAYADSAEALAWEERVSTLKQTGVDPETAEMPQADLIWSLDAE
jgi:L-rhamnose mutarotase